jgi:hypothetical protein
VENKTSIFPDSANVSLSIFYCLLLFCIYIFTLFYYLFFYSHFDFRKKNEKRNWIRDDGKEIKVFLDNFAKRKGFDPLVADNWYKVTTTDIRKEVFVKIRQNGERGDWLLTSKMYFAANACNDLHVKLLLSIPDLKVVFMIIFFFFFK